MTLHDIYIYVTLHTYIKTNKHTYTYHPCLQGRECFLRTRCLWGMCTFLWATDRPVLRLGEDLREQALHGGVASLQTYSDLAVLNLERAQLNYKLRPKW